MLNLDFLISELNAEDDLRYALDLQRVRTKKDLSKITLKSRSVMFYAIDRENTELVDLLLAENISQEAISFGDNSYLLHAAYLGNLGILSKLVNNSWAIKHRTKSNTVLTAFIKNAKNESECLDGVQLLVEKGADVNATTSLKKTPIYFAYNKRFSKVAKFLLEHGADPDIVSKNGISARDMANRRKM